jgi:hypothetical protein
VARAVKWHSEHRMLVNGQKTVVIKSARTGQIKNTIRNCAASNINGTMQTHFRVGFPAPIRYD